MNLARCFDQILQVGTEEEIAEMDEFAVVLIFDIDDAPAVLAASDLTPVDGDRSLGADDGEGHEILDGD